MSRRTEKRRYGKYNKFDVVYAETHNLSISQLIRMGVELQMKQHSNQ